MSKYDGKRSIRKIVAYALGFQVSGLVLLLSAFAIYANKEAGSTPAAMIAFAWMGATLTVCSIALLVMYAFTGQYESSVRASAAKLAERPADATLVH